MRKELGEHKITGAQSKCLKNISGELYDNVTNLQKTNAPQTDYSGVEFIDVDTPEDGPADMAQPAGGEEDGGSETFTQEHMDAALANP